MTGWPTSPEATATPVAETPEQFVARRDKEIQTWLGHKVLAAAVISDENESRQKVFKTLFPTPKKGTQHYELGKGYKVTLTYTYTYTLGDKDKVDDDGSKIPIAKQIEKLEDAITAKHGDVGAALLKTLITWEPKLSASAYEKLDKDDALESDIKVMISEHLTIKPPGTPQLTFVEPKAE